MAGVGRDWARRRPVAYGPVPSLGLGLVVYRNASAARAVVTAALAGTFEQLNQDPTREEKLFLVEPAGATPRSQLSSYCGCKVLAVPFCIALLL